MPSIHAPGTDSSDNIFVNGRELTVHYTGYFTGSRKRSLRFLWPKCLLHCSKHRVGVGSRLRKDRQQKCSTFRVDTSRSSQEAPPWYQLLWA
jgi:hypothetical protein